MAHFDCQLRIDNKIRAGCRARFTARGGAPQIFDCWLVDIKNPATTRQWYGRQWNFFHVQQKQICYLIP